MNMLWSGGHGERKIEHHLCLGLSGNTPSTSMGYALCVRDPLSAIDPALSFLVPPVYPKEKSWRDTRCL